MRSSHLAFAFCAILVWGTPNIIIHPTRLKNWYSSDGFLGRVMMSVSFIAQQQFLSTRFLVPIPLQSRLYDWSSLAAIDLLGDLD